MTDKVTQDITEEMTQQMTEDMTKEMVTATQITSERGTLGQSTTAAPSSQTDDGSRATYESRGVTSSIQDATDPVTDHMSDGTTYQKQTSKLATDHSSQNQTSDYYGTTDSFSRWPATAGGSNDPATSDGLVNFETTHPEYTSEHTGDGGSSSFVTRRQRTTVHSEERRTYPYSGGFTGSESKATDATDESESPATDSDSTATDSTDSIATDSTDETESIATGSTDETESITTDSKDETESIATDESRDIMTSSAETVTMFTSGSNPLSGWSEWTTCSEPCGTGECFSVCFLWFSEF
eukprot:sb/3467462/